MLRRILQNLLANAVRYTERGEVKLAARKRGNSVRIEVWDTGPGIAEAERTRIFEEFERGAASARSSAAGFGLGLSIVQRTARALDHEISVCSRMGRGTCFSVTAPMAETLCPSNATMPNVQMVREAYGFPASRVLVIDNDATVLTAMTTLLERWGCISRSARDLAEVEAITASGDFSPDIVLADFHLDHGACGIDIVTRLRERHGAGLPAIIVTADHSSSTSDDARRAACEILCKPVKPAELRALMSHLLG